MYASEDSGGVEEPLGDAARIVRRAEAEDIGIGYRPRTQPGSKDIPIDSDNPGYCPSVWIEGAWAVVRLGLDANAPFIVPRDYA